MTNDFLPELRLVGDASASRLLELADSLKRLSPQDEWAIFIGAGLSVGSDVPGWNTFLREAGTRFKVSVGTIDEDNYPRVAQDCLEAAPTPDDFWAFTEERLCGTHGSDHAQRLAIGLPFQLFLTTNFDCLLEAAHSQIRAADPRRLVYPDLPARHGCEGRLVYLHGRCDCDKATGQRIRPEHIVFTQDGYDRAYDHQAGALPLFVQSIFSSMRVLLVGFSLSDFPLRQLLNSVRQALEARGRAGDPVSGRRHLAIVPYDKDPDLVTDYAFRGLNYGVDPIYYYNPPGAQHEPVTAILEWLSKATAPGPSARLTEDALK